MNTTPRRQPSTDHPGARHQVRGIDMFYGAFPPEFNSGRMYTGPGAGSMLAAAAAWDDLATELQSTASSYSSVISGLTSGPWIGPSSLAMAAAAAPYVAWMQQTAAQAHETAGQATEAASAYETAFAANVPPDVIADNRSPWRSWWRPTSSGRTPRRSRPPRPNTANSGPRTARRWTPTSPPRRPPPTADRVQPAARRPPTTRPRRCRRPR